MEKGKGKARGSSTIKREVHFGKVPLPGTREGHGGSMAIACSLCTAAFRLTFGQTLQIFDAIPPDLLAATPGKLPSSRLDSDLTQPCALIIQDPPTRSPPCPL